MAIETQSKDFGKIVQLVANTEGWSNKQTRYRINTSVYIGGNPTENLERVPDQLREPLQRAWLTTRDQRPTDFNGPKVAVTRLEVMDGILITEGVRTDYFTLWGLPKAAPELFERHEAEVIINKAIIEGNALYVPNLPWGICTHNIVLDKNGDTLMMVSSASHGFHAGKGSVTEERQTEPQELSFFVTSSSSFKKELGLTIPQGRVRLLGVAEEKGVAYPAFALVGHADMLVADLVKKWQKAEAYRQNKALIVVPMSQVDRWIGQDVIGPEVWGSHFLAGDINPDANIQLHPTSSWRMQLVQEYSRSAR